MPDSDTSEAEPTEGRNGVALNRRNLMKTAAVAGGVGFASRFGVSTSSAATVSGKSASMDVIEGQELVELSRAVSRQEDVRNVIDPSMRGTVERGTAVETSAAGEPAVVFTRGAASEAGSNGARNLAAADVMVRAARHTLENGNLKTSVALVTGDGRVLEYQGFDRVEDGFSDKAILYEIVDEESLRLSVEKQSFNGSAPRPLSDVDTGDVTTQGNCGDDPCGGCVSAPPGGDFGEHLQATCSGHVDFDCILSVYGCGTCKYACAAGPQACLVCVIIACGVAIAYSCCIDGELDYYCIDCGCATCCNG